MRKWPGVNASTPSSPQDKGTNGLLLRQASIWVKIVANSSNVSLMVATTLFKWVFMLFNAASQRPPKWGACSEINLHSMFWVEQNLEMILCAFCCPRNSKNCFSSWFAPTKLVPWSLQIKEGLPRRATNHLKQAMKASEVRSDTI